MPFVVIVYPFLCALSSKTDAAADRKPYPYPKTSLKVLTNAADGVIIVSISQKWL